MATVIADNIGVNPPKTKQVNVESVSPSISQLRTPHLAETQKVGVLIDQAFPSEEVMSTLNFLKKNGVFVEIISEKLGTVTGTQGISIRVDRSFQMTYPVLYDSIYVVGGRADNQGYFHTNVQEFIHEAYKHYKPIGVASTAERMIQASNVNNLIGVVFARDNPEFANEFLEAIAQQRFWNRT